MKETPNIFISWFVCYKLTARSNVGGYEWNTWHVYNLICLLRTYCHLSTNENLSISWQLLETYGIINYGNGWRKDVNKCLEFVCVPTFSSSKKEMFAKIFKKKYLEKWSFNVPSSQKKVTHVTSEVCCTYHVFFLMKSGDWSTFMAVCCFFLKIIPSSTFWWL